MRPCKNSVKGLKFSKVQCHKRKTAQYTLLWRVVISIIFCHIERYLHIHSSCLHLIVQLKHSVRSSRGNTIMEQIAKTSRISGFQERSPGKEYSLLSSPDHSLQCSTSWITATSAVSEEEKLVWIHHYHFPSGFNEALKCCQFLRNLCKLNEFETCLQPTPKASAFQQITTNLKQG